MSETKMTRSKIAAFFREFPYLERLFNEDRIKSVQVSRVDESTADLSSERDNRIVLLDRCGHKVVEVGMKTVDKKWYRPSTWNGMIWFEERVSGAMARARLVGKACEVHVIVYVDWMGQLTLFKSPKGFSVQDWFDEVRRRDQEEIRAANNAVDNA